MFCYGTILIVLVIIGRLSFAMLLYVCLAYAICVCVHVYVQPVHNADFVIPVEIDGTIHQVCNVDICNGEFNWSR